MPHFILASGSPRRNDLLKKAGMLFDVVPSPAEEIHDSSIPLRELCEQNATAKAAAVAVQYPDSVVLGADTLVYLDQTPLGKPKNLKEAFEVLSSLSSRTHQVCTGLCIIQGQRVHPFSEITEVAFKSLTPTIIENYLDRVNVMDKAGSYALQEHGDMIIERVKGDTTNVIGLPVERTLNELLNFGLQPKS